MQHKKSDMFFFFNHCYRGELAFPLNASFVLLQYFIFAQLVNKTIYHFWKKKKGKIYWNRDVRKMIYHASSSSKTVKACIVPLISTSMWNGMFAAEHGGDVIAFFSPPQISSRKAQRLRVTIKVTPKHVIPSNEQRLLFFFDILKKNWCSCATM